MSFKEKIMNRMMENQFRNMQPEDKKQMMETMMDKFFSSMSDEEKKEMMSGMMPKMMEQMMGGGSGPMMSMMMGRKMADGPGEGGNMPWDMCREMMTGFKETANTAKFATEELRGLFDDWCRQIEKEILEFVREEHMIDIHEISEKFSLTEESIKYLLGRLAGRGLIDYKI